MGKVTGFKEYDREEPEVRPVSERVKDYKEIHKDFPDEKLRIQAARCMDCGTPFCNWGCPIANLMPDFNDLVYKGQWEKAFEKLTLTSFFPEFTGRVCPALCEGSCTLGVNRPAVSIKEIELGIIEKAYEEGWVKPNPPQVKTGKKVAVIGSGPAGLTAALKLNSYGHDVTVFEKDDEVGGLLRYGIPDFKLDKSVVKRRVTLMEQEGITFKVSTEVGVNYETSKLKKDFDAVLLTGGAGVPRDLTVEGRELDGVHYALELLIQQNKRVSGKKIEQKEIHAKDKVVVVIGGGDTGSDCIGTSVRQGAKAVYQYEIMPKPPTERDATMPWPEYPRTLKTTTSHEEGCIREWCVSTKKLEGKNGKLQKLYGVKVQWEKDENGRFVMKEIPGTEFEQDVDLVVIAMGFAHPKHVGLVEQLELQLDGRGNVATNRQYMTSQKGIFAAGDLRTGQSLVVRAIHEGNEAAEQVDKYLMGI